MAGNRLDAQSPYFLAGALGATDFAPFFCDFCLFVLAVLFGLLSPMSAHSFVNGSDWMSSS